jgi:hypothetical protein
MKENLTYPIQRGLFASYRESTLEQGLRSRIAQFYEILTAAIVEGEWNRNKNLLKKGYGHLHPDVICDDMLVDAKAIRADGPLKIRDKQFEQYLLHQGISTDNRSIFYSIFRYGITNPIVCLRKKENVLEEMISVLSKKTDFMILLPFSATINMHNPIHSHFSRYEKDRKTGETVPDPLTQIPKTELTKLFDSPEVFLADCGINPENYLIKRTTLPAGIKISGYDVLSFPILVIEDKDYKSWRTEFRENNLERIRELQDRIRLKRIKTLDSLTIRLDLK